jgi:hypothetical protein
MPASTIVLMGLWVVGARVVFSLLLDLRANWILVVAQRSHHRRVVPHTTHLPAD